MTSDRRRQLADKLADSAMMRKVVGPRILEPLGRWYEENVEPEGDGDGHHRPDSHDAADDAVDIDLTEPVQSVTTASAAAASPSIESARAAETFLAGPAQDEPSPRPAPDPDAGPGAGDAEPGEPAERPAVGGFAGVKDIALRVKGRIKEHNLNVVAAGVAFWGLLAIPAILTAVVSIYGLIASPEDVESQINDALSGASEDVQSIVGDQLSSVAGSSGGGLAAGAVIGIVLALWTSSGAVSKVIATLNSIWNVRETRKFVKLRGTAVAMTLGALVFIAAAAFALAALPAVLDEAGLGNAARWLLNIARFPAMLVFMAAGLSVLYWVGPDRSARFRLVTWGAMWATVLWLILSGLFSVYTASFASYNETYGSLGAIVVMLLWLFITAFMVLIGAEIDAAREERDAELAHAVDRG